MRINLQKKLENKKNKNFCKILKKKKSRKKATRFAIHER